MTPPLRLRPMSSAPRLPTALALTALLAGCPAIAGCADAPGPPSPAKVQVTLTRLGANPDTLYFEPFVATSPVTGQLSRQMIVIIPSKDGKTFQIVDSHGDVFDDYNDFLTNNTLPDQPGP